MTALPRDLAEWLPGDLPAGAVEDWALIGRSFDRKHGEALVLRLASGAPRLLTRPERFEVFRALPLSGDLPMSLAWRGGELQLEVRTVDGRVLVLPLLEIERDAVRRVLDLDEIVDVRRSSSSRPPPRSRGSGSDRPSTMRAPASAEMEVVRIPKTVRPAVRSPGATPPREAPSSRPVPRLPAPAQPKPGATPAPPPSPAPSPKKPAAEPKPAPLARRDQTPGSVSIGKTGARDPSPPPAREPASESSSGSVHPPAFAPEPAPIVRTARDLDSLRASFRHHWEQGALDEASQVARALAHMNVADAMELRLSRIQPESPPGFPNPLSPYLFRAFLAHDDEDADIGRLLAALWPAYLQMRARSDRELGLRPRDEIDLGHVSGGVGRLFAHGARAFSLDRPRFFLRTDVPGGMAHLHAWPVASLCGGTLATGFDEVSMLHVLGHHLSLYRHEAYLIALAPAQLELEAIVLATLHLDGRVPSNDARIVGLADALARHMVPPVREALQNATADLRLAGPDPRGEVAQAVRRHRRAVHHTAVRAGFALCGGLAVSDRMQRMMPAVPGIATDDLIDDLITYSVSPSWMALRKELGVAMEPSGANPPIGRG
ncbi:hypothetical protein [Sandaracinus amylolyticus]|uniref:hypothetical protein n=1 Tax=Sandaracinus amylolyticus TaxID=927083 RepID=UPI001F19DE7D|nr:hypothetical protein [Sandaracinus amylolyticus]UJR86117.1 Hypothetical protein I5071_81980 [Sandaracinus amylolyticus]